MKKSKGQRQGTRSILRRGRMERGRVSISRIMHQYAEGDRVAIVLDGFVYSYPTVQSEISVTFEDLFEVVQVGKKYLLRGSSNVKFEIPSKAGNYTRGPPLMREFCR